MIKVLTVEVPFGTTVPLIHESETVRVLFDDVSSIEIGGLPDLSNPMNRVSVARLLNTAGDVIVPKDEILYAYQGTNPTHNHTLRMLVISVK